MARFRHAPIERHEALAPFSRDHYTGLVQVQHLLKAADADDVARRKVVAEFVDAWEREIEAHFADEERLLGDLASDEDRAHLLRDHQQLTELAKQAKLLRQEIDPDAAVVRLIGQTLEAHIRWEERELFVRLQEQLNPEQLAALQAKTELIERARPRSTCRPDASHPSK